MLSALPPIFAKVQNCPVMNFPPQDEPTHDRELEHCSVEHPVSSFLFPAVYSPPADCADRQRMLASQLNFLRFMADHETFAVTQRVFHLLQTDFDFQPLAAVCHRKPKCSAFLRRATWPE